MFFTMATVGIVIVLSMGFLWFLNSTAFKRLMGAGKAQVGKIGRNAWNADPIAILEQKLDEEMKNYQEAMLKQAEIRGNLETLKVQEARGGQEVNRIDSMIKSALNAKDEAKAKQYVIRLQREKEKHEIDKKQLEIINTAYENSSKKIKLAQTALENLKQDIVNLKSRTRSSEVEKKLSNLLTNMNFNFDMDGIQEAKEQAEFQINQNRGAAMVQAEIGTVGAFNELEEQEREREDNANALLDQYKKEMK